MNHMGQARLTSTCSLPIEDKQGLKAALADANVPTLLMVYITYKQDEDYLRAFEPYLQGLFTAEGPSAVPEELAEDLRRRLFALLTDPNPPAERPLDKEFLRRMMSVSVGEDVDPEIVPVLYDQMGFERPVPRKDRPGRTAPPTGFRVLIIGGGMTGIAAGVKLAEAGYTYTIIEKNSELGGTWWENRYPGVGVDTPSHFIPIPSNSIRNGAPTIPRGRRFRITSSEWPTNIACVTMSVSKRQWSPRHGMTGRMSGTSPCAARTGRRRWRMPMR